MNKRFAETVVLISGGSSGLGMACAQAFIEAGARVAILDLQPPSFDGQVAADSYHFYATDVSASEDVEAAIDAIGKQFGRLDLCINCAGIAPAKRVLDKTGQPLPLDAFARVININLVGSFNVARCAAALMANNTPDEEGQRGVIINTASVAAFEGQMGQSAYAASKGGIVSLTLPMARDLAASGIRVNAIAPGVMGTAMMRAMPEKVQQSLVEKVQFPNRLGDPKEFAQLAMHIADNRYINGEVIRIDGGIRMPAK